IVIARHKIVFTHNVAACDAPLTLWKVFSRRESMFSSHSMTGITTMCELCPCSKNSMFLLYFSSRPITFGEARRIGGTLYFGSLEDVEERKMRSASRRTSASD